MLIRLYNILTSDELLYEIYLLFITIIIYLISTNSLIYKVRNKFYNSHKTLHEPFHNILPDWGNCWINETYQYKLYEIFPKILIIISIIIPFIFNKSEKISLEYFQKYIQCMYIFINIKSISQQLTLIPDSSGIGCKYNCRTEKAIKDINKIKDIFTKFKYIEGYCDMIPSGHTALSIISNQHILNFLNISKEYCLISYIILFLYFNLIITLRSHYSIDIWMSICLSYLILLNYGYK